jgi:putative ABC transport system ATP-binding protein
MARALFRDPQLLLCDEPTGNLDVDTGRELIALLGELHRGGLTVVAVTHEDRMSAAAQRVLKLTKGTLMEVPVPKGEP